MSDIKEQHTAPRGDHRCQLLNADHGVNKETLNETVRSPMATIQNDDERLLAQIGYKQVRALQRLMIIDLHSARSSEGSLHDGPPCLMPSRF